MESSAEKLLIGILAAVAVGAGSAIIAWREDLLKLDRRLVQLEVRMDEADPEGGVRTKDVVFFDDFTGNGVGWDTSADKFAVRRLERGKFYFETRADVDRLWWSLHTLPGALGDFTATLQLQWIDGSAGGHFGLVLGWDIDNFILVGVTPEGHSRVGMQADGDWLKKPISSKRISGIHVSKVVVRVSVKNEIATYYVGDEKVGRFPVKEFGFRTIGVYASDKQRVEFDSLTVESEG